MHRRTILSALAASVAVTLYAYPSASAVSGFTPPSRHSAESLRLATDILAVSPTGLVAASTATPSGAVITLYNHAEPNRRVALATLSDPALQYVGGLAFGPGNTLLVSENGLLDTVLAYPLKGGASALLAPAGSMPNVSQVRVRPSDGAVFAIAANPPGQGILYRVAGGQATVVSSNLGHGYLGGLAFDRAGNIYLGDTNDPTFMGLPGRVLVLSRDGAPMGTISLAGGNGTGVYDLAFGPDNVLYATTGATITRVSGGQAAEFGRFSGAFPFPTDITVDRGASLLVNALFTGAGDVLRIRPEAYHRRAEAATPRTPAPAGIRRRR